MLPIICEVIVAMNIHIIMRFSNPNCQSELEEPDSDSELSTTRSWLDTDFYSSPESAIFVHLSATVASLTCRE